MLTGTETLRFPESVFAEFLQTTFPFNPNLGFAFFHMRVLLTFISEVSKSKSSISSANSSLILKAEARRVLQMILNRLFALVLGSVSK